MNALAYRWWIERMRHAASLNDLVRIDHFRGFESFWSVPYGAETARKGEWVPGPGDALVRSAEARRWAVCRSWLRTWALSHPRWIKLRLNHGYAGHGCLAVRSGRSGIRYRSDRAEQRRATPARTTTTPRWAGFSAPARTPGPGRKCSRRRHAALEVTGGTPETHPHGHDSPGLFKPRRRWLLHPCRIILGLGSEARLNVPGTTLNNWRWRSAGE